VQEHPTSYAAEVGTPPVLITFDLLYADLIHAARWLASHSLKASATHICSSVPILLASWFGGFGPGMLATILAASP